MALTRGRPRLAAADGDRHGARRGGGAGAGGRPGSRRRGPGLRRRARRRRWEVRDVVRFAWPAARPDRGRPLAALGEVAEISDWYEQVRVVVATDGAGGRVVRVTGELASGTAAYLDAVLEHQIGVRPARLVVDLSAVSFLGVRGLAALVRATGRADQRSLPLAVVVGNRPDLTRVVRRTLGPEALNLHSSPDSCPYLSRSRRRPSRAQVPRTYTEVPLPRPRAAPGVAAPGPGAAAPRLSGLGAGQRVRRRRPRGERAGHQRRPPHRYALPAHHHPRRRRPAHRGARPGPVASRAARRQRGAAPGSASSRPSRNAGESSPRRRQDRLGPVPPASRWLRARRNRPSPCTK